MNGHDYIANDELTTRDGIVATKGSRCDRVPPQSLPWLLEQGMISPAPSEPAPAAAVDVPSEGGVA